MKILVLNPSSKVTKNVVRDVLYGCWCKGKRIGGGTVPPFALLSLATILKTNGLDVDFRDASAEQIPMSDIINSSIDYDVVIISTSTMSFNEDAEILQGFKNKSNKCKTIIFGSHPTFMPKYSLEKKSIDFIVLGEPELSVLELCRALKHRDDFNELKKIAGIGFRHNEDKIINNVSYFENIDDLPFPDVTMLPKDIHYFNPIVKRTPYITATMSRGCPGKCTFCTAPFFYGPKIRFKSDERVIEEMKYYAENGFKEVYFRDETFIIKNKRDKEFCKKLIETNLDLTWLCNCRVGMVTKKDMHYMKKSGCHLIKFGVESGVQEILDNVKKGIQVTQTKKTFEWAKEEGIDTHAHVMLGMPGETKETVEKTVDFILEIQPTTVTFGICSPYPGSPLFNEVAEKFPKIKDGTSTDLSVLHTKGIYNELYTELTQDYLDKCVQKAYRKFYLRPGYFLKTLGRIKSKDDIKRFMLAGTNIIDFAIRGE